jgi:serine/threonine protein kinase
MLNKRNELVLVDFGVSKCFEEEDDVIKGTLGTMLYYAPEIVRTGVKNKVVYGR